MKKTICALLMVLSLGACKQDCYETFDSYSDLKQGQGARLELREMYCFGQKKDDLLKRTYEEGTLLREDPEGNIIVYEVMKKGKVRCLKPYSIENPSKGLEEIKFNSIVLDDFYIFPFMKFSEDVPYNPLLIKALKEQRTRCE